MEEKAVRGVPWTMVTFALTRLLTLATMVVLARLLVPADFGVVALAILVIGVMGVVGDVGLGSTLVLRQDLDRHAQGTVFSLMLGMGVLAAALLAAISPLVARLLGEPRLTPLLAVLALSLVLNGVNWFYEPILLRELEFRSRFGAQVAQALGYTVTAVAFAVADAGYWSLVAGQLAGASLYAVALLRLTPYRVRPRLDRAVARDVLGTSRGFMAQGGLAFLRQNADYAAVGRVLGSAQLGVYSVAYRLSEIPSWAVADPVAKVTFPGFARMRARGEDVVPAFLSALHLVMLVTLPMGLILSAAAGPLTRVVFGERWLAMIGPLTVLGVWGAVRPLQVTLGWFVNSLGHPGRSALVSAAVVVPLFAATFLGAHLSGASAVACAMLGEVIVTSFAFAFVVRASAGLPLARIWRTIRPLVLAGVAAWIAVRVVAGSVPDALAAAASAPVGLAVYLALAALLDRSGLRGAAAQLAEALGRRRAVAVP